MTIWDKEVAPNLNDDTGAFDDSKPVEPTELKLPKPKRAKEDTEDIMDKKIDAAYSGNERFSETHAPLYRPAYKH